MNKGLQQIYKKVLYVSRLMNLLLSEIGDFLEKKLYVWMKPKLIIWSQVEDLKDQ